MRFAKLYGTHASAAKIFIAMPVQTSRISMQHTSYFATVILAIMAIAFLSLPQAGAQDAIEVKTYLDRNSGGWADKVSDYAFVVERDGCRIQWNAAEEKNGTRSLVVHSQCKIPFSRQAPLHRAILKEISAHWEMSSFKYISWGSFCNTADWSWCIPIAEASLQSKEFINHLKKYPTSGRITVNHIFIRLANETQAYKELSDIVEEFGATIELRSVEKVFTSRLKQTPFYEELRNIKAKGDPWVMYDAGMTYFYIKQ